MSSSSTHRARIVRVLDMAPEGLTCKQIERMTGIRHATASAALTGLSEQMKVFRLAGFRKPYHWVTVSNLRGRPVIGKPVSRKDLYIQELEGELAAIRHLASLSVDYPTTIPYAEMQSTPAPQHTEQREHLGEHS